MAGGISSTSRVVAKQRARPGLRSNRGGALLAKGIPGLARSRLCNSCIQSSGLSVSAKVSPQERSLVLQARAIERREGSGAGQAETSLLGDAFVKHVCIGYRIVVSDDVARTGSDAGSSIQSEWLADRDRSGRHYYSLYCQ